MEYTQDIVDILTYNEFLKNFTVYSTYNEAQCKGFEAHHIVPRALKTNDDRCIRCTPFEHIIAHYLMAKDYGGEYARIFFLMMSHNLCKLNDLEKVTITDLKCYSELREDGIRNISERYRGTKCYNNGIEDRYFKTPPSDEWKLGRIYKHSEELRKQLSESHKGVSKGSHSEETKQKISKALKGRDIKKRWYTNGEEEIFSEIKPEGYVRGRIHRLFPNRTRVKDTEEAKKHKSESAKRRCQERGQNNSIKSIDIETGIIYPSINDGLRALGFSKSGWRKSHHSIKSKFHRLQIYQVN